MAKKGYRLVAEVEPLPVAGDPPPATRWSGGLRTAHLLLVLVLVALYLLVQAEIDYVLGRYDRAISGLEQALEMNHVHPRTHLWLIALYEQVERSVDAQWMVEQLLLLHPRVSLSRLHGAFPFKNHQHLELLLDGLRKAGVPGS